MMSQQYPNGPPPAPQQHFQPASHQQVAQVLDLLQQKNSTPKTTSPAFVEFNPANQTSLVATPIEGLDPPNEDERSKLHCAVYGKALKVWVVGKLVTENVGEIILCPPGESSSSTSKSKSLSFAKKEKLPNGDAWFFGADIAACLNYRLTMYEYLAMKKGEDSELDSAKRGSATREKGGGKGGGGDEIIHGSTLRCLPRIQGRCGGRGTPKHSRTFPIPSGEVVIEAYPNRSIFGTGSRVWKVERFGEDH